MPKHIKNGYIRPLKHTHLLIHTLAILIGLIIISIQSNSHYQSNYSDHHTSFQASSYMVDGIYCK